MPLFAKNQKSVARRIRTSLILAAALPLLMLASVSYVMVSQKLQDRALREAHEMAKGIGMAVYDRLKFVTDELRIFQDYRGQGGVLPQIEGLDLENRTHGLFRVTPGGGVSGELYLDGRQREQLLHSVTQAETAKPLLIMSGASSMRRLFILVAGADTGRNHGWLGAELSTEHLWDTADISVRPERVCVLGPDAAPVFCNFQKPAAWLAESQALVEERGRPQALSPESGEPVLTAAWSLFLKPHYQFERWTVLVGIPESQALVSIKAFDRIFAAVAAIALVLAFALGSRMIKSNLQPLARLGAATRELSAGRFSHRVTLDSGDEFEQLGDAFNSMASRIGRQIDELEALARLDHSLQRALSLSEAIEAATLALTAMIGPGRCAVLCHEHWEVANTLWYTSFSSSGVSEVKGVSTPNLGTTERTAPVAGLMDECSHIRFTGIATTGLLQVIPVVQTKHVKAEILLTDPKADDAGAEIALRVADVLATTLSKLVLDLRLRFQAQHDWLTGLPNRLHMQDLFQQWAEQALRQGGGIGVLILNLDRFKQVNDAHGHDQGDRLLVDVAARLSPALPEGCVLSRFGSDEFVVMTSSPDHYRLLPVLNGLSKKINEELDRPLTVAHREVRLSASMGSAVFPRHGDCFDALLQSADAALRAAKASRRGSLLMFSSGMRDALAGRMDLEQALKEALANNEIVLHYQPVVDAFSHKVVGAEALMRWQRPGTGLVYPAGFIDVAEDSGLIVDFGAWAMTEVCRQLYAWRQAGFGIATVSVNVSGLQLADPGFEDRVHEALQTSGLEPGYLTLEVTETALIGQFEESAATLGRLRKFGVKVVVDDFGTGYASFKYLKMLPVDGIKIDRLFVKDLPDSPRDGAIVTSVVSLARANQLKLVAEGIETKAQARFLREAGVRRFQGFLFDGGLPADEFEQRLRRELGDQTGGAMSA